MHLLVSVFGSLMLLKNFYLPIVVILDSVLIQFPNLYRLLVACGNGKMLKTI